MENGLPLSVTRQPTSFDPTLTQQTTLLRAKAYAWNVYQVDVQGSGEVRSFNIDYNSRYMWPMSYRNSLNQRTDVQYDDNTGQLLTAVDPNGVVSQNGYDPFGRQYAAITPTEISTATYAPGYYQSVNVPRIGDIPGSGMIVTTTTTGRGQTGNSERRSQIAQVDAYGRVVQSKTSGLQGSTLTQEFVRDWAGRVVQATVPHTSPDASQGSTLYEYDVLSRLLQIPKTAQNSSLNRQNLFALCYVN